MNRERLQAVVARLEDTIARTTRDLAQARDDGGHTAVAAHGKRLDQLHRDRDAALDRLDLADEQAAAAKPTRALTVDEAIAAVELDIMTMDDALVPVVHDAIRYRMAHGPTGALPPSTHRRDHVDVAELRRLIAHRYPQAGPA